MSKLDELNAGADSTARAFAVANGRLFRPDGQPFFGEDEMRERTAALLTEATQKLTALESEADSLIAQAAPDAEPADDLTAYLTPGELTVATGRAALIALEAGRLSLADVAQRCEQALRSQDRVSTLVWMNVAATRIAQANEHARQNSFYGLDDRPVNGPMAPTLSAADAMALGRLRPLVEQMRAAVVPADARRKAQAAKATLEGARSFKRRVAELRDELDGSAARHRAVMARDYREGF